MQDAKCVPCSSPPTNARHISGGLPYTYDGCLWACEAGFFRGTFIGSEGVLTTIKLCIPCNTKQCVDDGYPASYIRETCLFGSTRDAVCLPAFNDIGKNMTEYDNITEDVNMTMFDIEK
jgi:hypothetical protein